jgi:hypothetical protein
MWTIFDTCHAADLWRGPAPTPDPQPIWRYVRPDQLRIPEASIETATRMGAAMLRRHQRRQIQVRKAAVSRPQIAQGERAAAATSSLAPWVGFYAAQKDEGAAEEWFADPVQPQRRLRYGVFTHALHEYARHWHGRFADLATALSQHYEQTRPFPTPRFEGPLDIASPFGSIAPAGL